MLLDPRNRISEQRTLDPRVRGSGRWRRHPEVFIASRFGKAYFHVCLWHSGSLEAGPVVRLFPGPAAGLAPGLWCFLSWRLEILGQSIRSSANLVASVVAGKSSHL
jgi:hypothetical protein